MNTKILSMVILGVFMASVALPVSAQEDEQALADLLNDLAATDQIDEGPQPSVDPEPTPDPDPMPMPEEKTEEHDAAEDILDLLGGDFEYAGPETIEVPVNTIEDDSAIIKTTQILFEGSPIDMYRVYYSTNTIADFLDVDDLQEMDLSIKSTQGTMVELELMDLDANTTYYLIVAPVDPTDPQADPLDLISEEVRFTTKAMTPVVETTTTTTTSLNGMYVNDVSYTYDANKATVTWSAQPEAQTVALSIKKSDSSAYMKLADVPASAGKYTFTVQESGLHLLKIETKNANGEVFGKEQIQSIKIDAVETPEAPVVTAPQVGPTQNLLIALMIMAIVAGTGYTYRRQDA